MSAGMPELGSKISLISKADIRYEGRLFTVDPAECTIALANVRSYGTEDRETQFPISPQNQIYDYILFRGSDIKDIRVVNNVPTMPNDPAIMQMQLPAQQIMGSGPSGFQPQQFPVPVMGHMGAQMGQFGGTYNAMAGLGGLGGLAPGANMSGLHKTKQTSELNSHGGIVVVHPDHVQQQLVHSPPSAHQQPQLPPSAINPAAELNQDQASVLDLIGGGSRSTTPLSLHSRKSPTADMGVQVNKKKGAAASSAVAPSVVVGNSSVGNNKSNNKDIGGGSGGAGKNSSGGGGANYSHAYRRTLNHKRGVATRERLDSAKMSAKRDDLAAAGVTAVVTEASATVGTSETNGNRHQQNRNSNQQYHANNQNRGWNNNRGSNQNNMGPNQNSLLGPNGAPGGNMRGQRPRGRGPLNQGGYRQAIHQQNSKGARPKSTIKFESDYDFEQANNKFEELRLELAKLKVGEDAKPEQVNGETDKKDDSGNETGAGEHEQEDDEVTVGYDKTKSFFDNISCEAANDRTKGKNRTDWRHERKINSETFGVSARRGGFFNYRGRGGGYFNRNNQNNQMQGGGGYRQNNGGYRGQNNGGFRGRNYNNRSYQHQSSATGIPVQPTTNKQQEQPQVGSAGANAGGVVAVSLPAPVAAN